MVIQILQSAVVYIERLSFSPFQTYVLNQFYSVLPFPLSREKTPCRAPWAKSLCNGAGVYYLASATTNRVVFLISIHINPGKGRAPVWSAVPQKVRDNTDRERSHQVLR